VDVTVLNRQRARAVRTAPLAEFVVATAEVLGTAGEGDVAVCLLSDRGMRELNTRFRGVRATTDVLSFPDDDREDPGGGRTLGDIVISVPRAALQARERGHGFARELKVLALHGYLHLLGYDHERDDGAMMRLQARVIRRLLPARGGRR